MFDRMMLMMMNIMMTSGTTTTAGGNKWSINSFLKNLGDSIQGWGKFIVFAIGGVCVIAAAYFIAKGLMSQGRGQTNWALTILLLIIGGAMMAGSFGGWSLMQEISNGMGQSINELGGSTILMHAQSMIPLGL